MLFLSMFHWHTEICCVDFSGRGLVELFLPLKINCFNDLVNWTRFCRSLRFIGAINAVAISAWFAFHTFHCISCVPAGLTLQMLPFTAELTLQTSLQFLLVSGSDVTDCFCTLQTTLQTGQWVWRDRRLSNSCEASGSDVTDGIWYSGVTLQAAFQFLRASGSDVTNWVTLQAALQFLRASGSDVTNWFCIFNTDVTEWPVDMTVSYTHLWNSCGPASLTSQTAL